MTEDDLRYRAVCARDSRFDGWFLVAVTTTGIYCRPSCPSVVPKRDHVLFFSAAAGAQRAGFRACKRCRPDASPGSPEWDRRGDVVARAMRAIADGAVDREGVTGLAASLGYSTRQLNRLLMAEVGAGALELARAQRAETARVLLETTTLRAAEIAFAAGFGSVRQFNDTVRAVFAETPTALRQRAARRVGGELAEVAGPGAVPLRLALRPPFAAAELFSFLAARAVAGVEEADATTYVRSLRLPHGLGVAEVHAPRDGEAFCRALLRLEDLRDLAAAVRRLRRLFDLDADPAAVGEVLGADGFLGPAVRLVPGLRVPGAVDGAELAVRAVLGQQVSVAGARTLAARLVAAAGEPLPPSLAGAGGSGSVVAAFPSPAAIAELRPDRFAMPARRARSLVALAAELAAGSIRLDPSADREATSAGLLALDGIGPWTVQYVRMRALGDPDAFVPSDLGVRRALERAGLAGDPAAAARLAEAWRPYRAYGLFYLWAGTLPSPIDHERKERAA